MFILLHEIARYSIKGNSELYAYNRQHTETYHISNNILGIVKFGVKRPARYAIYQEKPCSIFQISLIVVKKLWLGVMDPIYLSNNRDTLRVVTSLGYDLWSHFSMPLDVFYNL